MKSIWHRWPDEIPNYGAKVLVETENGSLYEYFYLAYDEKWLEKVFNREDVKGKVVRWAYSDDIRNLK